MSLTYIAHKQIDLCATKCKSRFIFYTRSIVTFRSPGNCLRYKYIYLLRAFAANGLPYHFPDLEMWTWLPWSPGAATAAWTPPQQERVSQTRDARNKTIIIAIRPQKNRTGLRHVRGVRPNRAADFRWPPFWTLKLAFILPLIAMLAKEPEMLQPDAFCEYTMQQNATAASAPQTPSWF